MDTADRRAVPDLGLLYRGSRERVAALVTDEVAEIPVPATPEWAVRDVVAHVGGVVEDALAGNLDGVATDPSTAAQVDRGRTKTVASLLDDWAMQAPMFEAFLSSPEGEVAARAVIDLHTHECDLRGALGRPSPPPDEYARWAFAEIAGTVMVSLAAAGLPSLRVETASGDTAGPVDAVVTARVDRHEFIRAYLGRRSPDQVRSWDWTGDPEPYVPHLAAFGPRDTPLVD